MDDLISGGDGVYAPYTCNKEATERAYCTRVIQMNGWKIPKNYPIPF